MALFKVKISTTGLQSFERFFFLFRGVSLDGGLDEVVFLGTLRAPLMSPEGSFCDRLIR